uniref:Uncharacterized protein n=1 Tax=Clastoptera arizonana TaxID=38151 RepID=A0A1B6EDL1_9HEMI
MARIVLESILFAILLTVCQGSTSAESKDLQTAQSKDFYYELKNKFDSLFKPLKNKGGSSYRQYYPSTNYQYRFSPGYNQRIVDCYDNGNVYADYSGASRPSGGYIGAKPVFSAPQYAESVGGSSGASFEASISGSIGGSGTSDDTRGYFKPSKPLYDTPTGNGYYYSTSYNSPKWSIGTPSFYISSGSSPQLKKPQFFKNSPPLQVNPLPVAYDQQNVIYVNPQNGGGYATTPSSPVTVLVPQVPDVRGDVSISSSTPSTSVPTVQSSTTDSVSITPKPLYQTPQTHPESRPGVVSIVSSDTYLSRPYYSPGFSYGYSLGGSSGIGANYPLPGSQYGFYYNPSFQAGVGFPSANNDPAFYGYPGSFSGSIDLNPGIAFPTNAPPKDDC